MISGNIEASEGIRGTSSLTTVINGWAWMASVIACENRSRSTASAAPAGTRCSSAARITRDPRRRISSFRRPTALSSLSPRKEFEQTSSASRSVLWTSVGRTGRISWMTAATPDAAHCHAASEPARPPPMMWTMLRRRRPEGEGLSRPRSLCLRQPFGLGPWAFGLPRGLRRGAAATRGRASPRCGSHAPPGLEQFNRLLVGQRLRTGRLRERRVQVAVGHVRSVSTRQQLDRRGAVLRQLAQGFLLRRALAARLLRRANQFQCRFERDPEHVVFRFQRAELIAVLHIGAEATEVG